jgi:hypothetical protein
MGKTRYAWHSSWKGLSYNDLQSNGLTRNCQRKNGGCLSSRHSIHIVGKCCLEGGGSEIRIPDPPSFLGRIYRIVASPLIAPQSTKHTWSTVYLRKKRLTLIYGITIKIISDNKPFSGGIMSNKRIGMQLTRRREAGRELELPAHRSRRGYEKRRCSTIKYGSISVLPYPIQTQFLINSR